MQRATLVLALGREGEFTDDQEEYKKLKQVATVKWLHQPSAAGWPSTFTDFVKEHGHPLCLVLYGARVKRVDHEFLKPLLPELRLLASQGAGYDNIDVPSCTDAGVWVSNTPKSVTDSTANCAIWLILSALRDFVVANNRAKDGRYREGIQMTKLKDPKGLKLGVVGLGRIGQSVGEKMHVFGMEIFYHSRHKAEPEAEKRGGDAKYIDSLDELLQLCDIITVHVPLSEGTKGMFDAKAFRSMKQDSIFINTARGGIHDESALADALTNGPLSRAGLDVFEKEPDINKEFMQGGALADRVLTTPHIGAFTIQTFNALQKEIMLNVLGVIHEDRPVNPVNDPKPKH